MFAIDDVLVSDALLDAPFACHLSRCLGGCCVHGDRGAPLEPDERAELERALPAVARDLRPEALEVIDEEGAWVEEEPGRYGTACVGGRECVFVVYDGDPRRPVAKCALQQAHRAGRIDFEKPLSCHLFPVRIETVGETDLLNYERIGLCSPAIQRGRRHATQLYDFLREPLTRKYGAAWYEQFRAACVERAAVVLARP